MQQSKISNIIDIGSSKIVTLIGQYFPQEDKTNIVAVAVEPAIGFRKGQIVNIEQAIQTLTKVIESAERMAGMSINSAHIAISAPYIESVNSQGVVAISDPQNEISPQDVSRAIDAAKAITLPAGKQIIHVIPRKYIVDGQEGIIDPINMTGVRLEVEAHIIMASTPALKNLQKSLDQVGVKAISINYSGLPAAHIALTDTEKELGVVLVDIGGNTTTLTVFNQASPAHSTVIPIGGNNITNDLAIGLRLSIDEAEKLKIYLNKIKKEGFTDEVNLQEKQISSTKRKISVQTAINGIIKPRLEEILGLVKQEIDTSTLVDSIPAGIVLTGGGSLTVNCQDIAGKVLNLPIRISSPQEIGGLIDDINTPVFTSAIGLLMYSQDHQKNQKNSKSGKKFSNIFDKIKNLIEPLLP